MILKIILAFIKSGSKTHNIYGPLLMDNTFGFFRKDGSVQPILAVKEFEPLTVAMY
jgi:hypothetical protein